MPLDKIGNLKKFQRSKCFLKNLLPINHASHNQKPVHNISYLYMFLNSSIIFDFAIFSPIWQNGIVEKAWFGGSDRPGFISQFNYSLVESFLWSFSWSQFSILLGGVNEVICTRVLLSYKNKIYIWIDI